MTIISQILLLGVLNNSPALEIKPLDFGVVQSGEAVTAIVEVVNQSEHEVVIHEVTTSCPCFSVKYTPTLLDRQDTLRVPVTINTSGRVGETTQTITFVTDQQTFHTTIHGVVKNDLQSAPAYLTLKYPAHLNQKAKFYVWSSVEEFQITGMDYDAELVDVSYTKELPKYYHEPDKYIPSAYTFDVKLAGNYKHGDSEKPVRSIITVKTDSPKRPEVEIEVSLLPKAKSIISFSPSSWIFNSRDHEETEFLIHLLNDRVQVIDISCTIGSIEVVAHSRGETENWIQLDFRHKGTSDLKVESGHVVVETNYGVSKIPLLVIN